MRRMVIGISGSSGAIFGARLVEVLSHQVGVETHLVISNAARHTISYETDYSPDALAAMADHVYDEKNVAAGPASGTFRNDGMIVAPCSIKTLSAIANSYADNLITRAADVALKERRKLVLVVRETPLHLQHIRLMAQATEAGAVILPPVPGFYIRPKSVGELVDHVVTKILDQFGIDAELIDRWSGKEIT